MMASVAALWRAVWGVTFLRVPVVERSPSKSRSTERIESRVPRRETTSARSRRFAIELRS